MSRPTLDPIEAEESGWVSTLNSNFQKVMTTPFPIKTYATTSALDTAKNAGKYGQCVVLVETNNKLYFSDDADWVPDREQMTYVAALTGSETVSDLKDFHNDLITDLIDKGYMASS